MPIPLLPIVIVGAGGIAAAASKQSADADTGSGDDGYRVTGDYERLVDASESTPPQEVMTVPQTTEQWRRDIEPLAGDIDVDFVLRWVAVESGGNPAAIGMWGGPYEAGIGQIYFETAGATAYGVTLAQLRAGCADAPMRRLTAAEVRAAQVVVRQLTDEERSWQVSSLMGYVRDAVSRARRAAPQWDERSQYAVAKVYHGLPFLASQYLRAGVDAGAIDWRSYASWVRGMSVDELRATDKKLGLTRAGAAFAGQLDAVLRNAEKTAGV